MLVSYQSLPRDSIGATRKTISAMRRFAEASSKNILIIQLAREIVAKVPAQNYRAELEALFSAIGRKVRYTRDPSTIELVQTPEKTLQLGHGDCDDFSTLMAALALSIGFNVRFVAAGNTPGQFEHVWTEAMVNGKWIALDHTAFIASDGAFGFPAPMVFKYAAVFEVIGNGGLSGKNEAAVAAIAAAAKCGQLGFYCAAIAAEALRDSYKEEIAKYKDNVNEALNELDKLLKGQISLEEFDASEFEDKLTGEDDVDTDRDFLSEELRGEFDEKWNAIPEQVQTYIKTIIATLPLGAIAMELLPYAMDVVAGVQQVLFGDSTIKAKRALLRETADTIGVLYKSMNQGSLGKVKCRYWRNLADSTSTRKNSLPDWVPGSTVKQNRKRLRQWLKQANRELIEVLHKAIPYAFRQAEISQIEKNLWLALQNILACNNAIIELVVWARKSYPRQTVKDALWYSMIQFSKMRSEINSLFFMLQKVFVSAKRSGFYPKYLRGWIESALLELPKEGLTGLPKASTREANAFLDIWTPALFSDPLFSQALYEQYFTLYSEIAKLEHMMKDAAKKESADDVETGDKKAAPLLHLQTVIFPKDKSGKPIQPKGVTVIRESGGFRILESKESSITISPMAKAALAAAVVFPTSFFLLRWLK